MARGPLRMLGTRPSSFSIRWTRVRISLAGRAHRTLTAAFKNRGCRRKPSGSVS